MEKRGTTAAEAIGLTAEDCDRLTALYHGRLAELGPVVKTVGWRSVEDQYLRFDVLCRSIDLAGRRVLDIGCGLGDFVGWAEARGDANFDYVGVDLSEELVGAARERFGGPRRQFLGGTVGPDWAEGSFDVVVSSGALSFRTTDNIATMRALLAAAWARTTGVLCVNFLSSYVDFELEKNFHFQPETVLAFAKTLSPWVALHHDYPLFEFTIQIFRLPNPPALSLA